MTSRTSSSASSLWLRDRAHVVTSQYGEDGVLQAIYERIGEGARWFCEFGAWDGEHLSNTFSLLRDHGWSGVMIEGDAARAQALAAKKALYPGLNALCGFVAASGPSSLDNLLATTPIPEEFDCLSIDIDNDDYFVWEGVERYRPRVVVIEVNSQFGPDVIRLPKPHYRGFTERSGCSFASAVALAKSKGYELALHTGNCIFVQRQYCDALSIDPNGWRELFAPAFAQPNPLLRRLRTAAGDIAKGRAF